MGSLNERLNQERLEDIADRSRPCARRESYTVGATYWNAYWRYTYTVEAVYGSQVIIRLADGRQHSHMTALDWRRDRVLTDGTVYSA